MRSAGWHKAEFGFTPGEGIEGRIDGYGWTENVFIESQYPDWIQIQTGYGTSANNVWVADIGLDINSALPPKNFVDSWMDYDAQ